jgi:hypothetical protein
MTLILLPNLLSLPIKGILFSNNSLNIQDLFSLIILNMSMFLISIRLKSFIKILLYKFPQKEPIIKYKVDKSHKLDIKSCKLQVEKYKHIIKDLNKIIPKDKIKIRKTYLKIPDIFIKLTLK